MQEQLRLKGHVKALVLFVKACAASIYCLETLQDATKDLMFALNLVENQHIREFGARGLPHVQ